jgi:hypothetical protein
MLHNLQSCAKFLAQMLHDVQKCRLFCSEAQMSTLRQLPGSELSFRHICSIPQILVVFSDSYKPYNIYIYIICKYRVYNILYVFIIGFLNFPHSNGVFGNPWTQSRAAWASQVLRPGEAAKGLVPHLVMSCLGDFLNPICAFAWFVQ